MVRTQVQLTELQANMLKRASRERGVSMAEMIRQAVDALMSQIPVDGDMRNARALDAIGAFESDPHLSERHDAFAFGEEPS
jgi:hypothetical protein